ncbi:hypothetical protein [Anaeromyxobacter paludicola]|uniref:Large polyvalent protein associated domain-containing protein n=1 Tax=Anaeromyxobacter paludicola TaxID=2918171 RepID=A0ABN6N228_9BACT|nr:hypothetical protein [Anaeromyxobacter paludicola]BDG06991.1 hypothetical protein AMPC_01040 [Anaeromyxobacter paludicola]
MALPAGLIPADAPRPDPSSGDLPAGLIPDDGASAPDGAPGGQPPLQMLPSHTPRDQREDQGRAASFLRWQAQHTNLSPEQGAEALRLAAATGHPISYVAANLELLKSSSQEGAADWPSLVQAHPPLAQFLLADPARFSVAKDDLQHLTGLSWALKAGSRALSQVAEQQEYTERANAALLGLGGEANAARLRQLEAKPEAKYGDDSVLSKIYLKTVEMLPALAKYGAAAWGGAEMGAAAGALAGGVGAAPGAVIGGAGAMFMLAYYDAIGPMFRRLVNQGVDPQTAQHLAVTEATVVGGINAGLGPSVVSAIPGVKQALQRQVAQTLERQLAGSTVPGAIRALATRYGEHVAAGAALMAGQSAVAETTAQAGASLAGGEAQWDKVPAAAWKGLVDGMESMAVLGAWAPGREFLGDLGRARASSLSAARVEAAITSTRASTLADHAPEEFAKLAGRLNADGDSATAYIDRSAWDDYWKRQSVDPAAMARLVAGDEGQAYGEATATGGDLAVPLDKFLSKLSKAGHAEQLRHDLRLSVDELTPRQVAAERERLASRVSELATMPREEQQTGQEERAAAAVRAAIPPAVQDLIDDFARSDHERATAETLSATQEELVRRIAEHQGRENQDWYRAERARLETQVRGELDEDPVHRAILFLQRGEVAGGPDAQAAAALLRDEQGRPLKLDRNEIVERFGSEVAKELSDQHRGVFGGKRGEGAPVDDVAGMLGFRSADDLVNGMRQAAPREEHVREEVARRLGELYGPDLLEQPHRLTEAALDAAHNEAAARRVLVELRSLARQVNPAAEARAQLVDPEVLRRTSERLLADKPVAQISPTYYLQAELGAARRAYELARDGKIEQALAEKEAQTLDHFLYREARDLRKQLDVGLKKLKGSARDPWRSELGKADPSYRDVHDQVLEALGLATATPPEGSRRGLDDLLALAAADGNTLPFDVAAIRDLLANPRPWKALTATEAQNVLDTVQSLRHFANHQNELELMGRRMSRQEFVAEAIATAEKNLPKLPSPKRDPLTEGKGYSLRLLGQALDAATLNVETAAHILDGGDRNGPFHRLLVDERLKARDKANDLAARFLGDLERLFKNTGISREELYELFNASQELPLPPDLARDLQEHPVTRANLLMMLANLGNDSNAERFLGGYEWTRDQVQGFLEKHLKGAHARWVQGLWDLLDGLYPEMARIHAEEDGIEPKKIRARPFTFRGSDGEVVEMRGGYFPAKYDPRVPTAKRTAERALLDAISDYLAPDQFGKGLSTPASHAKGRAEHYEDVVNLNFGIVPSHVLQVIQDTAYRPYVKKTAAVLLDPEFSRMLTERLGPGRASMFRPWLRAVAHQAAETVPEHLQGLEGLWLDLKGRAAFAALAYSLPRTLANVASDPLIAGTSRVDPRRIALVAAKLPGSWAETRQFVLENSPEVRDHDQHLMHRLRQEMSLLGGKAGTAHPLLRAARDSGFVLMEMGDRLVSTIIWKARYDQTVAAELAAATGGGTRELPPEAERAAHRAAVRDADDAVREVLPPSNIADKPALLRDRNLLGGLTLFMGHANKMWQLYYRRPLADIARTFRSSEASIGDKASVLATFAGRVLATSVVNGIIAEYLAGSGQQDDETRGEWYARKAVAGATYPMPPILGGVLAALGDRMISGQFRKPSVRTAPGAEWAIRVGEDAWKALDGDEDASKRALMAAELAGGLVVYAPPRQVEHTLGYVHDLATHRTQARGPFDLAGGLIYGENPERWEANPLTDLQDAVSGAPGH